MARKKMITVYAEILQETEKAILVRCDADADGEWLPKSQIKYSGERGDTGVKIEIPELLADEKGFFDGMGRRTVTFYGSCNEENWDENGVVFTIKDNDGFVEFSIPHDQIVSFKYDMQRMESAFIIVSYAYAIEAGMMEYLEGNSPVPSASGTFAGKRQGMGRPEAAPAPAEPEQHCCDTCFNTQYWEEGIFIGEYGRPVTECPDCGTISPACYYYCPGDNCGSFRVFVVPDLCEVCLQGPEPEEGASDYWTPYPKEEAAPAALETPSGKRRLRAGEQP